MVRRRNASSGQLPSLLGEDVIDVLLRRPEDQWFDRKSSRTSPRQLGDLMVGFANAEGGHIAIGVHNGKVEGVTGAGMDAQNEWRQAAVNFTEPPVRHTFELIDCVNVAGEPDQIAVIEVESAERVHTNVKGETFLRIGDENRRLGVREAQELRFDKGDSSFDALPVHEATTEGFDQALVNRYLEVIRAQGKPDVALVARGLAVRGKAGLVPTVAGVLMLGVAPQRIYSEAYVRILQYQGASRETGVRSNVVFDRRIEGTLSDQIEDARRTISRRLPRAMRLGSRGRFSRATIIPESVWLEAVVNAVTHRSYSMGGDHIRVEIFDDRLEVQSPGRLPGLVRIENLRSTRFARNPRVARSLSDLGYGRELGEGVDRMFEEMNRYGLPDPVYQQSATSVRVILLADTLVARLLEHLPDGSQRFAEHLNRRKRISTTEAVDLLGVSRPTALRYLHELAERGFLEHTGTTLKDPRGVWRLADSGSA